MPPTSVLGSAVVEIDVKVGGLNQLGALNNALGRIGSAKGAAGKLSAIGAAANQAGQQLRQLSFVLRDAGRQLLIFAGVVGGALIGVSKVAADFEQSIANVKAVITELADGTPVAESRLQSLTDEIREVALTSRFTAVEVSRAAETLGLAGFSAEEATRALSGTLDLAAAGSLEVARAAEVSANALRAWGLDASQATRVADVLAFTATNANTNVSQLGEAFKLVSATAANFGISIEESAGAVALLSDAGLRGSIGGTSLNRLLVQLGSNSKKLSDFLAEVGVSASEIDPLKNSLADIVEVFEEIIVTGKATQTQLTAALDQRAARSLNALIIRGSENLREFTENASSAAGTAEEIANIKLDTAEGQFLKLKSAVSEFIITLGETFQDELKVFLAGVTQVVTAIATWIKDNKELVLSIIGIVARIGLFVAIAGTLLTVLGSVAAVLASLILVAAGVATGFAAVTAAAGSASVAVGLFIKTLIILTGGLFAVVVVVGLVAAGITGLVLSLLGFNDAASETAEGMEGLAAEADAASSAIDSYNEALLNTIAAQEQLNAILAKGSTLTGKELEQITELINRGATLDPKELQDFISTSERDIQAFRDRIDDIFSEEGGSPSAAASAEIAALNADIEKIEASVERANDSLRVLRQTDLASDLDVFREINPTGGTQEFRAFLEERVRLSEEAAKKLRRQIEFDLRRSNSKDEVEALRSLAILEQEAENASKRLQLSQAFFSDEALDEYIATLDAGSERAEAIKASFDVREETRTLVEYRTELEATLDSAVERRTSLDQAVADFVGSGVQSEFQKAAELQSQLEASTAEIFSGAIDLANTNISLAGEEFTDKAKAIVDQAAFLGGVVFETLQKQSEQQAAIDAKRQELLDEQAKRRDKSLQDARKRQAEADRDIQTLEQIIRAERQEQLDEEVQKQGFIIDPDAAAGPQALAQAAKDRAEFERLFNEETEREIQSRKEQFAAEEERARKAEESGKKINSNATDRLKTEKDITSELVKQVKTFEDAARAIAFARNVQKERERDARTALREQLRGEQRLLELQDRRNELARKGESTASLDRQLQFNRRLLGLGQEFTNNTIQDAGNKNKQATSPLLQQFDQIEQDSQQLLEDARAKLAGAQTISNIFEGITEQFRLAPQTWVQALIQGWNEALLQAQPNASGALSPSGAPLTGQPVVPATIPGVSRPGLPVAAAANGVAAVNQINNDNRTIEITIEGSNQNPEAIAQAVMDRIAERQFT